MSDQYEYEDDMDDSDEMVDDREQYERDLLMDDDYEDDDFDDYGDEQDDEDYDLYDPNDDPDDDDGDY